MALYTVTLKGRTYPVKDDLQSWAFFWKPEARAWVRESVDEEELKLFRLFISGASEAGLPVKWPGVELTATPEREVITQEEIDEYLKDIK